MTLCYLLLYFSVATCNVQPVGVQQWPDGIVQIWIDPTGQASECLDRNEFLPVPLELVYLAPTTPLLDCIAYMVQTGDFPGRAMCAGVYEYDPLVDMALTMHKAMLPQTGHKYTLD